MAKALAAVPTGYHTITPWIIAKDAAGLIAFIEKVFDGKEKQGSRFPNPDGSIGHVEVELGDSVVMLFDRRDTWPPTPAFLRIYVKDVAATIARAKTAGSQIVTEITLLFFGEKVSRIRDPWGNLWWIHERVEEVDGAELQKRLRDPELTKKMQYVQESLDRALRG